MGTTETDTTPEFEAVMDLARRWYYGEIRSIADEAIRLCASEASGDADDRREWLTQWVDQTTDGHEYVIYTAKAGMALAASDCDTAYEDQTGEAGGTVEVRACYAMRADVWALLEAREDEWGTPPDMVESVAAALTAAGLPVVLCGVSADWSMIAWSLSDLPPAGVNRTDGAYYLLHDEDGSDDWDQRFTLVRHWINRPSGADVEEIAESVTLASAIAAYRAAVPVTPTKTARRRK